MAYSSNKHSGIAERNNKIQLPDSTFTEGESDPRDSKFAELVYVVNDLVTAEAVSSADVSTISTDQAARRIFQSGDDYYIAEAAAGSSDTSALWRIKQIDSTGNVKWVDGKTTYEYVANNYATYTYV